MAPALVDFEETFCISDAILEEYTLATLTADYIEVKLHREPYKADSEHAQLQCKNLVFPFAGTPVMTGVVCDSKILFDGFKTASKSLVELSVNWPQDSNYSFSPGDSVGIIVPNTNSDVRTVLTSLNLLDTADNLCEVCVNTNTTKKNAKVPAYIPPQTSIRTIVRDCIELRSIPKKIFLRSLVEHTSSPMERHFLASISSKEGSKLYTELILEKARTFLDIIKLCPSCCPPLSLLIEHLPRLRPRPYSIANSPLKKDHKIKFIFSVLPENPGVATSFLRGIAEKFLENPTCHSKVNFYFRESNRFIYNKEEAKNDNILIGVGCGLSPFLGFLESKDCFIKQNEMEIGNTCLFLGSKCKSNAVYREQILDYKKRGVVQELYESFSQETGQFKYVQHQIKNNAVMFVMQLVKQDTILYVCADGNSISKSINNCIKECLVEELKFSLEEADTFLKDSRMSGKYREDLWI